MRVTEEVHPVKTKVTPHQFDVGGVVVERER
jgi:hypothetical protein